MKETDSYLDKFEGFETGTPQPAWLSALRKAGIARFAEMGFPTLRHMIAYDFATYGAAATRDRLSPAGPAM